MPVMPSNINMEAEIWMPLSVDFQVIENCDGISQSDCEPMSYELSLVSTSGNLKVSKDAVPTNTATVNGSIKIINEALKNAKFLP